MTKGIENLRNNHTSEIQSRRRVALIALEQATAKALEAEGFEIYSPTVVCDRIAIRDGRVYFVEFKKPGQKLRAGQQRVQEVAPDSYLVRNYQPSLAG